MRETGFEPVNFYTKKKGNKSDLYWKAEWSGRDGKMKQAHLGPADGLKRGLSEDEALAMARKMKAEDLEINMAKEPLSIEAKTSWPDSSERFFCWLHFGEFDQKVFR